jgi:predicted ribosome quality control (RQC) complex YloA/Tae2 family protein
MRDEIASLDIVALMRELEVLEGARIDKVYQRDSDITINIYNPGDKKYRLFIGPGKLFLTSYKRDNPQKPPQFCMELRKHLAGDRIERIEQQGFDRVIEIHTDEHRLIAEIFGQGNVILVEKGTDEIAAVMDPREWSERALYRGETYKPPDKGPDPREMSAADLQELTDTSQIVKVLAAEVGLGGLYAEEVMARTDVEKSERSDHLADGQLHSVHDALRTVVDRVASGELAPRIYYDDEGDPAEVAPIPLATYGDHETEEFDSYSKALDTYFTQKQKAEYRRQQRETYRKRKDELEAQKRQQEEMLEGMKDSIEEHKERGDLIYENYGTIEQLVETIRKARKQYSNAEIKERLTSEKAEGVREAQIIEQLQLDQGKVVVDLGEDTVTLEIDESVEKNAERYYEKSKEAKRKVEGAKEALEETKQELEELEENKGEIDVEDAFRDKEKKKREKKWYEKFRWFFSSDGFLVLGGRDATSNEVLVKKHMEGNDRYVHADFEGGPSVVITNPDSEEIPETTLEEAAQLAVTFSKAWKLNVASDDAYHVDPEQVTKEPESGEYLAKGAFVIRGDREYLRNVSASAAVGAYEREDGMVAMGGPLPAIQEQCDRFVEVKQGKTKKSDLAKQIQRHLHDSTGEDFDLDVIVRALPPGKGGIKRKE